jgi:transposase-like protein
MAGKKGMKHYPRELKLEAIRMFFEEGKTRAEITQELSIRDKDRVKAWVREYRGEGPAAFTRPIGRPRKQAESEGAEIERLRMENALLKKLHTDLRERLLAKRNIGPATTTGKDTK